jgi:hypothetical protein
MHCVDVLLLELADEVGRRCRTSNGGNHRTVQFSRIAVVDDSNLDRVNAGSELISTRQTCTVGAPQYKVTPEFTRWCQILSLLTALIVICVANANVIDHGNVQPAA